MTRRPPQVCVRCAAREVVPIVWGLPADPDAWEHDDSVIWGGCIASDADHACRACGAEYADGQLLPSMPPQGP